MPFIALPTRDAAMRAAADALAQAIARGIAQRGAAAIALSGGGTPEPAYKLLADAALDWSRVSIALVDERFVPPSDAASNEAMIKRALAPAFAKGAAFAPLYSAARDVQAAADSADPTYAALTIDAALMGMGADGHTASWFADSPDRDAALDLASPRAVIAVAAPTGAGASARLTMTRAALAGAARAILLITGADKRAVWEAAQDKTPEEQPVAALAADFAGRLDVIWAP